MKLIKSIGMKKVGLLECVRGNDLKDLTGSSNESYMKEFTKYYGDLKDNIYWINRRFTEGYIRSVLSAGDMQLDTDL